MANQPKKYKKFVATAATATLVASAIVPVASAEEAKFSDMVNYDADTIALVEDLADKGIISGFEGKFNPQGEVSRKHAVLMIGRFLKENGVTGSGEAEQFEDVSDADAEFAELALLVRDLGIFEGNDGKLNPSGKLTRENMALVMDRVYLQITGKSMVETAEEQGLTGEFSDTDSIKEEARAAVLAAKALGLSKADAFNPKGAAKRVHFAQFFYVALPTLEEALKEVEELTIESVSAINETTISVTFSDDTKAEIKLDTPLVEGENKVTFTYEGKEFKDVVVNYKKPEEATTIVIKSAEARSNTEVTVVLESAPLKQLSASDFNISPSLSIVSVTTNNNVVTLKTSAQTAGTQYTVTPALGSGSATFAGLAAVDTEGALASAEVTNFRQLVLNFKTPVAASSVTLDKVYFGLTENTTNVALSTKSFLTLTGLNTVAAATAAGWEIVPVAPVNGEKNYTSYVLQNTKGLTLTTSALATGVIDELDVNTSGTVEVRNVKDANGAYTHTSQAAYSVTDKKAPTVTADGLVEIVAGKEATTKFLTVSFDEPVKPRTATNDFKVYINGQLVPVADINVDATTTVAAHKTMKLDVSNLPKNVDHTITIVGAEDLNGNVIANNKYEKTFKVTEKRDSLDLTPPVVKSITQQADNTISIKFDQEVKHIASTNFITIKNGLRTTTGSEDLIIKADAAGTALAAYKADGTTVAAGVTIVPDNTLASDGTTVTATGYKIHLEADFGVTDGTFGYDSQTSIIRDIVIENAYPSGAAAAMAPYLKMEQKVERFEFKRDVLAPTKGNVSYHIVDGKLYLGLEDKPFNGTIALDATLGEGIVVEKTSSKTVTKRYEFTTNTKAHVTVGTADLTTTLGFAPKTYLVVDLKAAAAAASGTEKADIEALLASNGSLVEGDSYQVTLPAGKVLDANETNEATVWVDGTTEKNDKQNAALELKYTIAVGTNTALEGDVPQTTKFLISSGQEIAKASTINFAPVAGSSDLVGTLGYFQKSDLSNYAKLIVVFEGEVNQASAVNKQNYTFNGKPLTAGTTVTFFEEDIIGTDGVKEKFVIVDLENGTVERDGLYTFSVFGVTNNKGKLMLPVNDSIVLTDNTSPVIQTIVAAGSRQVEVTFNEAIATITDATKAGSNFEVKVNGAVYNVVSATNATDPRKVILTLGQDLDLSKASVSVTTKSDVNGEVFVTDVSDKKNKIKTGVTVSK